MSSRIDAWDIVDVDHDKNAIVIIRSNLWMSINFFSKKTKKLKQYFDRFLLSKKESKTLFNDIINDNKFQSTNKLIEEIFDKKKDCLVYSTSSKQQESERNFNTRNRETELHFDDVSKDEAVVVQNETTKYFVTEAVAAWCVR